MEQKDGMTKETVVLDDGRYLIYYEFPIKEEAEGCEEGNPKEPARKDD